MGPNLGPEQVEQGDGGSAHTPIQGPSVDSPAQRREPLELVHEARSSILILQLAQLSSGLCVA